MMYILKSVLALQILKKSPSPGPVVQKPKCQVAEEHPKPDLMEAIVTHIEHPGHVYIQLTTAPNDGLTELVVTHSRSLQRNARLFPVVFWPYWDLFLSLVPERNTKKNYH